MDPNLRGFFQQGFRPSGRRLCKRTGKGETPGSYIRRCLTLDVTNQVKTTATYMVDEKSGKYITAKITHRNSRRTVYFEYAADHTIVMEDDDGNGQAERVIKITKTGRRYILDHDETHNPMMKVDAPGPK